MIQSLKMAMKSILGNKLRAFLTMLGIIIGVMSLVVLVSLVSGATSSVTDTISSLATDMLSVSVGSAYSPAVTLDDIDDWALAEHVGEIAPSVSSSMTGKYDSASATLQVYGVTPSYDELQGLALEYGRFLKNTDLDNHSYVCVLSGDAAESLVGYTDCVGYEIALNGI